MATTVTLDSDLIDVVMEETKETTKAAAVRKALEEWVRHRRIQELRAMCGTLDMQFTNEEIEAMEDEE